MKKSFVYLKVSKPLLCLVGADGSKVEAGMTGIQCATWLQKLVSCHQDRVKHGFPQQKVAHPFTDDDVNLLGELNGFYNALNDLDNVT